MRAKKVVSIMLAVLTFIAASACSGGSAVPSQSPSSQEGDALSDASSYVNPPGIYPIVKYPITLSVTAGNNGTIVEDYSANEFTIWYEELTGIHIDWDTIPSDSAERIQMMIASGSLPDIIMATSMTSTELVKYAENGFFLPLNDYIDQYAPNIKKMLDEVPIAAEYSYTADGKIYALNRVVDSYNESIPKRCWVYEPWMETLNINMPSTTDEFYEMLVAFRDMDPNGTGKKDIVPFSGSESSPNGEVDSFILNSFLYYDKSNYGLELKNNGTIVNNIVSDEYREGLRYLNKLLNEKLLDPATFTQDRVTLKALTEGGEFNRLGCVTAFYWGHFTTENGPKGRDKEFTAVPVLKGPKGVRNAYDRGTLVNGQRFEITMKCKYPEAAIRWADYFFDPDGMMDMGYSAVYGKEGVSWKRADGTVLGLDGKPAKYEALMPHDIKQNFRWFQQPPYYESADFIYSWSANQPNSRKDTFGNTEQAAKYKPYSALEKKVPFMFIPYDLLEEYSEVQINIKSVVEKYKSAFILGDMSLDKDWNQYVKDVKNAGVDRYVELTQQVYDSVKANR